MQVRTVKCEKAFYPVRCPLLYIVEAALVDHLKLLQSLKGEKLILISVLWWRILNDFWAELGFQMLPF